MADPTSFAARVRSGEGCPISSSPACSPLLSTHLGYFAARDRRNLDPYLDTPRYGASVKRTMADFRRTATCYPATCRLPNPRRSSNSLRRRRSGRPRSTDFRNVARKSGRTLAHRLHRPALPTLRREWHLLFADGPRGLIKIPLSTKSCCSPTGWVLIQCGR